MFATKYPLRKMDMVAIPDFKAGAMENWGLITYRDTAIYYGKKNYAESNRCVASQKCTSTSSVSIPVF
jgi:aminopeptidase N